MSCSKIFTKYRRIDKNKFEIVCHGGGAEDTCKEKAQDLCKDKKFSIIHTSHEESISRTTAYSHTTTNGKFHTTTNGTFHTINDVGANKTYTTRIVMFVKCRL